MARYADPVLSFTVPKDGHITLKAAPRDRVPLCVQGYVAMNFVVKIGYASEPIYATVKK